MLRTNLASFRVKRLGVCASLAWTTWAGLQSEGWASPPKEYPDCASKADDTNVQAARGAFEAGKAAFNEADYPRAIVYWEDAFRRDCSATLMLKNLARAYEASGQYSEAAVALKTYLTRATEAEDKAELEEQLRTLEAKIQQAGSSAQAAPKPVAPKPTAPPHTPQTSRPATQDTAESTTEFDSEAPSRPVNGTKVAAGLIAGSGLALGAVSTGFWLDAEGDEKAATDQCPTRRDCPKPVTDAGNDAIDRKQLWTIVGIGGGALLVGGVVWYLIAAQEDDQNAVASSPRVVPTVAPGFAGLTWSDRF